MPAHIHSMSYIYSYPPEQNGRHFADNRYKLILINEKFCIFIKTSLNVLSKCPIDNKPVLVQVMAWRRTGDNPLSEPMMTRFNDAYI